MRLYREGDSFLHRRHPLLKLAAFAILSLAPTLYLSPAVPAAFGLVVVALAWAIGGITPIALLRRLVWVVPAALGVTWINALFYAGPRTHLMVEWGPLRLYSEGLEVGASIGLRILCLAACSLLFVSTTDPTRLTASLVQQGHLPYRVAYAALAAYRFLPIMLRELETVRAAYRVRSAYAPPSLHQAVESARRVSIPLLVNGVRRAERLAMAMEARGFGARPDRTYYVRTRIEIGDLLFLVLVVGIVAALLIVLAHLGWTTGFLAGAAESVTQGVP